jgi:hypothetical protein
LDFAVKLHDDGSTRRQLVQRLRGALVSLLTEGSWKHIEDDHRKVGLTWRPELEPGWGKPKYVERVLEDLPDEEVIIVARRAVERLVRRDLQAVEDALLWIDAGGVAGVSEVTRLALAKALEGRRLHPGQSPGDLMEKIARSATARQFDYDADGSVVEIETDWSVLFDSGGTTGTLTTKRSSYLRLLDAYGFRDWPDARIFRFVELLVHPTVRQGSEQAAFVQLLNIVLAPDRLELFGAEQLSGQTVFKVRSAAGSVGGRPKNIIFASTGPKPELGFADAINNDIVILRHAEHCLVYDDPLTDEGLHWTKLVEWWAARDGLDPKDTATRNQFGERLRRSLASEPERRFFNAYFKIMRAQVGEALPALVPQVYLHYDPMTLRELRERGGARRFDVQRMDFLLLLPHGVRVVVEIDGQQHYSTGTEASAKPSPEEYARTVRSDRHLRLAGYEVYRFGGYELRDEHSCATLVEDFFARLFRRHKVFPGPPTP